MPGDSTWKQTPLPPTYSSGVQFRPPPTELAAPIQAAIQRAVAELSPEKNGALVGVVTQTGINAAVVVRFQNIWTVQAWIGKTWASGPTYGADVKASW